MNLQQDDIIQTLEEAKDSNIKFIQFIVFEDGDNEPVEVFCDVKPDEDSKTDLIEVLRDFQERYSIVDIGTRIDGGYYWDDSFLCVCIKPDMDNLNIDETVLEGFLELVRR